MSEHGKIEYVDLTAGQNRSEQIEKIDELSHGMLTAFAELSEQDRATAISVVAELKAKGDLPSAILEKLPQIISYSRVQNELFRGQKVGEIELGDKDVSPQKPKEWIN